ncbi:MAG: hypothetical protein R2856_31895 [Caldilineaceae bacterium]
MPHIDRLVRAVELDGGLTLFLKVKALEFLKPPKGALQGEAGGRLIDLDHTGIDAVGELEGAPGRWSPRRRKEAELGCGVGLVDGVVQVLGATMRSPGPKISSWAMRMVDVHIVEDSGLHEETAVRACATPPPASSLAPSFFG